MILTCHGCGEKFESDRRSKRFCSRSCSNTSTGAARKGAINAKPRTVVWSCGGGVDSTAIAALIVNGVLPKPDIAVIVDVGWEKRTTWEYANAVTIPRLKAIGLELQIIRTTDFRSNWFFDSHGSCAIPAYRRSPDGTIVKFNTQCSSPWKLRVVKQWLRQQGVESVENWVGIAADESHRARGTDEAWFQCRYPLIELNFAREDCQYYLAEHGWPRAIRSSCVMCPQMSDREWIDLKTREPEEWQRAVALEQRIRQVDPGIYLHRSGLPLEEAELNDSIRFPRFPCVCFGRG